MHNTRFNPTMDGGPHLGHLMAVLLNEQAAHESGGLFTLRFDDTQEYWNHMFSSMAVARMKDQWLKELAYFGVVPDRVLSQMKVLNQGRGWLPLLCDEVDRAAKRFHTAKAMFCHDQVPIVVSSYGEAIYPFTDYYTLEKVMLDFEEGDNLLIRGEELLTEYGLYCHYVHALRIPRVEHVYIPRLRMPGDDNIFQRDSISKTVGQCKLEDFIAAKVDPLVVRTWLGQSALANYNPITGPMWSWENLKRDPAVRPELLDMIAVKVSE